MFRYLIVFSLLATVAIAQPAPPLNLRIGTATELEFDGTADSLRNPTHIAVGSNWFDPSAWNVGGIPGDGSTVIIPKGSTMTYSGQSDARIKWIRVDGEFRFAKDANSKLVIDTLVVGHHGVLQAGTEENPIEGSVEIVISDNGDIDVNWDVHLHSRGILSNGTTTIHGAKKYVHGKVETDPVAGDTSITMAEAPTGWKVGDTIVIAGTNYYGPDWYNRDWRDPQDEVRIVSNISGRTVSFADPLKNDHKAPRSDLKTSVANYTRNVTIRSEKGAAAEVHRRGHVMFMHSNKVDVRYASFWHLGRTNKAVASLEAIEFSPVAPDSNARGRYSVHLHHIGADDITSEPAIIIGNSVFGSPGWGYVQHSSYAIFHNNASYDTFGAGYVAEGGNEIGTWTSNIAIWAKGVAWKEPKMTSGTATFDHGNGGDGFFFQGRLIKNRNNVAASVNHGYAFFHRGPKCDEERPTCPLPSPIKVSDYPDALFNGIEDEKMPSAGFPIIHFNDNEAFAARAGLQVTKASPRQEHDVHSVFKRLTAWNVLVGAELTYTSHYHMEDFDLVGRPATTGKNPGAHGVLLATNTADMTILTANVESFVNGITLKKDFTFTAPGKTAEETSQFVVVNPSFSNNGQDLADYNPEYDQVDYNQQLPVNSFKVVLNKDSLIFSEEKQNVDVTGTKYDGLGTGPLPAGADSLHHRGWLEIAVTLGEKGYWKVGSEYYFLLKQHFTDRATGEVHKFGLPVKIDPAAVSNLLGTGWLYSGARLNSDTLNLTSAYPVMLGERKIARPNQVTTFTGLLDNDTDPEGDTLELDGFSQPEHGIAYQKGSDTIVYRPDFDYQGSDYIKYWAVDSDGKYSAAIISINVTNGNDLPSAKEPANAEIVIK